MLKDKFTIAFVKNLDIHIKKYNFDKNLLLVPRDYDFIKENEESLLKSSGILSLHNKRLLRECTCCLIHYQGKSGPDYSDKAFLESQHLFIYAIEALRLVKASKVVALLSVECEREGNGALKFLNSKIKRQPEIKFGLKKNIFSKGDLKTAQDIFKKIYSLHKNITKETNQLVHAILLYNKAIFTEDHHISYLMLVMLLECLFSFEEKNQALKYCLSNNLSWFLAEELEERENIFWKMQKIYNLRSKIIHGTTVNEKLNVGIHNTITELREFCRKSLEKIFYNDKMFHLFAGSKRAIDNYLKKLTLGIKT